MKGMKRTAFVCIAAIVALGFCMIPGNILSPQPVSAYDGEGPSELDMSKWS